MVVCRIYLRRVVLFVHFAILLAPFAHRPLALSDGSAAASAVNQLFARKLDLYRVSLPKRLQALAAEDSIGPHLLPTLRFLYKDVWTEIQKHQFVVPEFSSLFEGEASSLFGNITYAEQHSKDVSYELYLNFLIATLNSYDPTKLTTIWTAYPISRRAVVASLLERYLRTGSFTPAEAKLITTICQRLFQLHRQAAQTKRIIEFFHVSKSGGTSFCQLGRLNGCKTESFERQGNCLITYFRDHPRWTKAGALGELSQQYGDPWCARYGRQYSLRWHCRSRRQLLTRMRYNFYSNELVMHDHNRTWRGVHPCREFLNVVIFREPEARVVSHMQNILKEYVAFYNATAFWRHFDPASPSQWRSLAVPLFDNYVVRSLLGGQAYNMPYGSVHEDHLLAAKVVTLQFEVLLSLTPQTSELTADIFALGLGWHFDLRHLHARPTQQRAVPVFAPPVMDAVRAGRKYDQQLYEFALVLQLLDALAFGVAHEVGGVGVAGDSEAPGTGSEPGSAREAVADASAAGEAGSAGRRLATGAVGGAKAGTGAGADMGFASAVELGARGKPPWNSTHRVSSGTVGGAAAVGLAWGNPGAGGGRGGSGGVGLGAVRRKCGYVGIKQRPVVEQPVVWEPAPAIFEPGLDVVGLGGSLIQGGRWFNGTFFHNATEAAEAALAAARAMAAAAAAEAEAAAAAEAAAVAAAAATSAAGGGGA